MQPMLIKKRPTSTLIVATDANFFLALTQTISKSKWDKSILIYLFQRLSFRFVAASFNISSIRRDGCLVM